MKTLGIRLCLLLLFVSLGGIAPAEKRTQVYYNPEGGKHYHAVPDCASASEEYYPLTPIPLEALHIRPYLHLTRCPFCNARKKPPIEEIVTDAGESGLRTLKYAYDDDGLLFLSVTMNAAGGSFYRDDFPPACYLDTFHDGDAILMDYENGTEEWFMTFEYVRDDWRLTYITNGQDWDAKVENGVCTFDDICEYDAGWQWSAEIEDRLLLFDFERMAHLAEAYNAAMPERPSLQPIETE